MLKAEEFWADQELAFPAVYDFSGCNADFHHFVPAYDGEKVGGWNLAKGKVLTEAEMQFAEDLTDQEERSSSKGGGGGCKKWVSMHLIITSNSPPPEGLLHREVWLIKATAGSHLDDSMVWHFPGEAPRTRPLLGTCGNVAKMWNPNDKDPEKRERARAGHAKSKAAAADKDEV